MISVDRTCTQQIPTILESLRDEYRTQGLSPTKRRLLNSTASAPSVWAEVELGKAPCLNTLQFRPQLPVDYSLIVKKERKYLFDKFWVPP